VAEIMEAELLEAGRLSRKQADQLERSSGPPRSPTKTNASASGQTKRAR
jgi:hypothetical protein